MMNEQDYIERMVGKPYLQGSDCITQGGIDCWGIIKDYFSRVRGVQLDDPAERINIEEGGLQGLDQFEDCASVDADVFTCWKNDVMTHCGIITSEGVALHAVGEGDNGQVMLWPLRKLIRAYGLSGGRVEYHKWRK